MIKAVITYYYKGTTGIHGGFDGRGHYATIITGDDFIKVNDAMYKEAQTLVRYPRITDVVMTIQEYNGDMKIKEIRV